MASLRDDDAAQAFRIADGRTDLIDEARIRADVLLREHQGAVEIVAEELLLHRELSGAEVASLIKETMT